MTYDFRSLGHPDFEELCIDLVNATLNLNFRGYSPGPDGGVDGRHSKALGKEIILQAKHYVGSTFPTFMSALKKEKSSIDKLSPSRYILATSQNITPRRETKIVDLLHPHILSGDDVFGSTRLNKALRDNPKIERAHIKLWLSSAAVLDKCVNAAADSFNNMTRDEIARKIALFATNPSLAEAQKLLEERHALIVSGPPGIGKTTLAEMLAFDYASEGWEIKSVRNIDDATAAVGNSSPTIILFDDFLGDVGLSLSQLNDVSRQIDKIFRRVKASGKLRFIMTTRGYILEEARTRSDKINSKGIELSKYLLDIGKYTRRIRARILYNHLAATQLPEAFVQEIAQSKDLAKIIDHKNYVPRIVEWMTDSDHLQNISATEYPDAFLKALESPTKIWEAAYKNHIPHAAKHLLIIEYFHIAFGTDLAELRREFGIVHPALCEHYNLASTLHDFEDALKVLEGSFVTISKDTVRPINPSVNDFMKSVLTDRATLRVLAKNAPSPQFGQMLWEHCRHVEKSDPGLLRAIAADLNSLNDIVISHPRMTPSRSSPNTFSFTDISFINRFQFLAVLQSITPTQDRLNAMHKIASLKYHEFDTWRDVGDLPELVCSYRTGANSNEPDAQLFADKFEKALLEIIDRSLLLAQDAIPLRNKIDLFSDGLNPLVPNKIDAYLHAYVTNIDDYLDDEMSESDLAESQDEVQEIGKILGLSVDTATAIIQDRIDELPEETDYGTPTPIDSSEGNYSYKDNLTDVEIYSMFSTLKT